MTTPTPGGSASPELTGSRNHEPANLADVLERVLDKGLVVAGDIQVNLLDIELLTIKLRLVIASLETAREVGIDWWEHDPWLTGDHKLERENRQLRDRLAELEGDGDRRSLESPRRTSARADAPEREEARHD
ncbi:MAG: gas vesicle protein [Actinophytocola sp.]|nr:gas vesicle protein [Actinophytocola sp.]